MTSESTRKVIDQLNASNEDGKAEFMVLDSEVRRLNAICSSRGDYIEVLKGEIMSLKEKNSYSEKAHWATTQIMYLSLVFGFAAIGYAVWV